MAEVSHPLLAPLGSEQQRVVDLVADAFLSADYQWPYFDYVEAVLDADDLDAMSILQSFPTIGGWNYGAVAWNRNDSAEAEVALTVVGINGPACPRPRLLQPRRLRRRTSKERAAKAPGRSSCDGDKR